MQQTLPTTRLNSIPNHRPKHMLERGCIDDPCDAIAIHAFPGMWGCLASGIFACTSLLNEAGYDYADAGGGAQFSVQLGGCLIIFIWAFITSAFAFFIAKRYSESESRGESRGEGGGEAESDVRARARARARASVMMRARVRARARQRVNHRHCLWRSNSTLNVLPCLQSCHVLRSRWPACILRVRAEG